MENIYTSTGVKLIHHPEVVALLKKGMARPISLQIAPTSACNLKCEFCSNVNRTQQESLDPLKIVELVIQLDELKTVEWTGGGDPTLYEHICALVEWTSAMGLAQGFITNGIALHKIEKVLPLLKWLRISMNCLDYVDGIDIPKFDGALGFSYVMNGKTTNEVLARLDGYVKKHNPRYVRIVPNCQATDEQQRENNAYFSGLVEAWGRPYFYQAKTFSQPGKCYWAYLKPFVLHDGWVYPCSSVVLNGDAERQFHSKYRWVRMEDLPALYSKPIEPLPTENCNHCVFHQQNETVDGLINPNGFEDFV